MMNAMQVYLVTKPGGAPLGWLYWSVRSANDIAWHPPHNKSAEDIESSSRCLALADVTDLHLGTQEGDDFNSKVETKCCLSITTRSGQRLQLEAQSEQERDSWAFGILAVLSAAGQPPRLHDLP